MSLTLGSLGLIVSSAAMSVPVGSYPTKVGVALGVIVALFAMRKSLARRDRPLVPFCIAFCFVSGFATQFVSRTRLNTAIDDRFAWDQSIAAVSIIITAIMVVEALKRRPRAWIFVVIGALATLPNASTLRIVEVNAWKYWLAWPVAVALIGLARGRPVATALAHVCVIALCLINDFRSAAALTFVSLVMHIVRKPIRNVFQRFNSSPGGTKVLLGAGMVTLGTLASLAALSLYLSLALSGTLGPSIEAKQMSQATTLSSVFSSGRVESTATLVLFHHQPVGYGLGVIPPWTYLSEAAGAIQDHGGTDVQAASVVYGGPLRLHSIIGELWYSFGIAGLLVGAMFIWLAITLVTRANDAPYLLPPPLLTFLGVWQIWDLLFSPLASNWAICGCTMGVSLAMRARRFQSRLPDPSGMGESLEGSESHPRSMPGPTAKPGATIKS